MIADESPAMPGRQAPADGMEEKTEGRPPQLGRGPAREGRPSTGSGAAGGYEAWIFRRVGSASGSFLSFVSPVLCGGRWVAQPEGKADATGVGGVAGTCPAGGVAQVGGGEHRLTAALEGCRPVAATLRVGLTGRCAHRLHPCGRARSPLRQRTFVARLTPTSLRSAWPSPSSPGLSGDVERHYGLSRRGRAGGGRFRSTTSGCVSTPRGGAMYGRALGGSGRQSSSPITDGAVASGARRMRA